MNRLLLLLSNTLLVLLEVIVLTFFASVFFKKNLSTVKFLISIILLAVFNIAALALLDKYFWLKAFVLIIVDAIWLKISYIDTIIQSIGIAVGFYCKHMGCSSPFSYFISIQERIFLIHGKSSRVLLNMLWSKMRGTFNCCYNRVTRKKAISIQKHYLA